MTVAPACRARGFEQQVQCLDAPVQLLVGRLQIEVRPEESDGVATTHRARRAADKITQQGTYGLLLPGGIGNGQPLLPATAFQAKLSQREEPYRGMTESGRGEREHRLRGAVLLCLHGFHQRLRLRW